MLDSGEFGHNLSNSKPQEFLITSDWKTITSKFLDMPLGWLDKNLSLELDSHYLYPNSEGYTCY